MMIHRQKQKAFSLIEVLVTLVILCVGLLGIAGIIVTSLKNSQSSYARSQASWLSNDIIDRMRANKVTAEVASSQYNLTMEDSPGGTGVAFDDLTEWRAALAQALPSGRGSVSIDDASKKVTIVVQWNNSRVQGGVASQTVSVESRL